MFRFHKIKQCLSCGVAAVLAAACFTLVGCETNRPEVRITLSFLDEKYEIDYELYRNLYPQTVRHFTELADAGYYNGLCVHDYTSSTLYMGGYTYEDGRLIEKNYFSEIGSLSLSESVFDQATGACVGTLYGEFGANGYRVENNAQTQKYGSLVMYYSDKGDDVTRVKTQRSSDGKIDENKSYAYNSATSLFYIFIGTTSARNSEYCTFGQLASEAASDALTALEDAIADYIDSLGEETFTEETTLWIDTFDPYVASAKNLDTFAVPKTPIVIESVEVLKY